MTDSLISETIINQSSNSKRRLKMSEKMKRWIVEKTQMNVVIPVSVCYTIFI